MATVRYFTADRYGQSHRVAASGDLAVCGRPIPDDAKFRTVTERPKGECARCGDEKLPDYTAAKTSGRSG